MENAVLAVLQGAAYLSLADNYTNFVLARLGYTGLKYTCAHLQSNLK